ncbi:UNVERIFIED_CONTAM: hypothetical protein NCL1_18957 [Trichonephila clavipes]
MKCLKKKAAHLGSVAGGIGRPSIKVANVICVRQSFQLNATKLACEASSEFQISQTSLELILLKGLKLHVFKGQDMLKNTWWELECRLDILRATRGRGGGNTFKFTEVNSLIKSS